MRIKIQNSRKTHHVTELRSSQTGYLNMTVQGIQTGSSITRSQYSRPPPLGRGGPGESRHRSEANKSAVTM